MDDLLELGPSHVLGDVKGGSGQPNLCAHLRREGALGRLDNIKHPQGVVVGDETDQSLQSPTVFGRLGDGAQAFERSRRLQLDDLLPVGEDIVDPPGKR